MKRFNHLFTQIGTHDNLALAFWKAAKGRRTRPEIRQFSDRLDAQLSAIGRQFMAGTFRFGNYRQFTIRDPKTRTISAPVFSERVVHHAIMNVCEPYFERRFIGDTFACRVGKGRDACLQQSVNFSRRFRNVVHLDIRSFFDSISHERMFQQLCRIFKDSQLLTTFAKIIDTHHAVPGFGLPIGTLISQHCANLYLAALDRFVKQVLGAQGYVRYMDDFALWCDNRQQLRSWVAEISSWLGMNLQLSLKNVSLVHGSQRGLSFLGHRVFPGWLTLNQRSRRRYRARLRDCNQAIRTGAESETEIQTRLMAIHAFAARAGVRGWRSRTKAIQWADRWMATSVEAGRPGTCQPRRQLEQRAQELPLGESEQELADQPGQQPWLPPSSGGRAQPSSDGTGHFPAMPNVRATDVRDGETKPKFAACW